jgi:hypothetical protein
LVTNCSLTAIQFLGDFSKRVTFANVKPFKIISRRPLDTRSASVPFSRRLDVITAEPLIYRTRIHAKTFCDSVSTVTKHISELACRWRRDATITQASSERSKRNVVTVQPPHNLGFRYTEHFANRASGSLLGVVKAFDNVFCWGHNPFILAQFK